MLSNIFLIIIACSILVFISVSFAKGRFDFNFFNNSPAFNVVREKKDKTLNITKVNDIDYNDSITNQSRNKKDIDKTNEIDSLDEFMKSNKKVINKTIEKQENLIKEIEINKDIKILQKKKAKSNFIWTILLIAKKQLFRFLKIVLSVKFLLFFGRVRCFNQCDFYCF